MPGTIEQTVHINSPASDLYATYLDPARHSAIVGNEVVISAETGAEFRAFGGVLTGEILALETDRMIVQSWRSANFHQEDLDSILILKFNDDEDGGRVDLIHANVPDHESEDVTAGWKKYYWEPWAESLKG
jgi:activator of HSP90 ATPase